MVRKERIPARKGNVDSVAAEANEVLNGTKSVIPPAEVPSSSQTAEPQVDEGVANSPGAPVETSPQSPLPAAETVESFDPDEYIKSIGRVYKGLAQKVRDLGVQPTDMPDEDWEDINVLMGTITELVDIYKDESDPAKKLNTAARIQRFGVTLGGRKISQKLEEAARKYRDAHLDLVLETPIERNPEQEAMLKRAILRASKSTGNTGSQGPISSESLSSEELAEFDALTSDPNKIDVLEKVGKDYIDIGIGKRERKLEF